MNKEATWTSKMEEELGMEGWAKLAVSSGIIQELPAKGNSSWELANELIDWLWWIPICIQFKVYDRLKSS